MVIRSTMLRRGWWPALPFAAALAVQGCAGGVSSQDVAGYDGLLAQGNYAGAASFAAGAGKIAPDGTSSNLLWLLNAGAATAYAGDSGRSVLVMDRAEDMMKQRDVGAAGTIGQYHYKTYDGVMVNAYKALAAMEAHNDDLARTELNRAEDRQRRAEDEFRADITAAQRHEAASNGFDLQGALQAAQSDPAYRDATNAMATYGRYKAFLNPFATYLAGLYFLNTESGDREKARTYFQRVRGMEPSPLLDGDYQLAAQTGKFSPKTWVIFENGQGLTLSQYSISFPVPVVGRRSGVSVATVALPRLKENAPAAQALLVGSDGQRTTVVGNFDYVMGSEFQRRYPSILRNAVLEAALKVVMMNVAAQEKSGIALLVATVASNISTTDVRSWNAMPKNFQAARIETPKDGVVRLRTDSGLDLGSATVPTDASSLVWVKEMRPGSPPAIQVLRF